MAEGAPVVLLVGHCGPDAFAMRSALRRVAPDAEFVFANDDATLASNRGAAAILVNRKLDGRFGVRSGIELIRAMPVDTRRRTLLVSDLPEAQAQAVEAGAGEGFGKRELYSERARVCMLSLLGRAADG